MTAATASLRSVLRPRIGRRRCGAGSTTASGGAGTARRRSGAASLDLGGEHLVLVDFGEIDECAERVVSSCNGSSPKSAWPESPHRRPAAAAAHAPRGRRWRRRRRRSIIGTWPVGGSVQCGSGWARGLAARHGRRPRPGAASPAARRAQRGAQLRVGTRLLPSIAGPRRRQDRSAGLARAAPRVLGRGRFRASPAPLARRGPRLVRSEDTDVLAGPSPGRLFSAVGRGTRTGLT